MNFHLFTGLFHRIDTVTNTFVNDITGNAITAAMPVASAAMTIAFIFYGFLVARGVVDDSLKDFVFKCFKIGIIVSIASVGGLYQSQIADAIAKTPDEFATALLPSAAKASESQGNEAASVVDQAAAEGFSKAAIAFEKAATFDVGLALSYAAMGVIIVVSTALMTAIGGAFILLAKLALAVLAGVGPIFILALLFKPTVRFFEAWTGQVMTYVLLVLLVASIFGLLMQIFTSYMSHLVFEDTMSKAGAMGGCLILAIATVVILLQLPNIAGSLGSGVSMGLWYELRQAAGIGRGLGRVGGAAARGSAAVGSAAYRYSGAARAAGAVGRAVGRFRGSRSQAAA